MCVDVAVIEPSLVVIQEKRDERGCLRVDGRSAGIFDRDDMSRQ